MDYSKAGLKAGLEIHQQLDTGRKLFCHCPAYLRSDKPDFIIHRKLHKVAGETGEIDVAVEYEAGLDKEFVYEGYNDNVCLLDVDECPPYLISEEALDEALKIALLLNCEIYPVSQIMRKMVIDGSNTSGFQRTAVIAHDGFMETTAGKVGIETIALEEDAARIVERGERRVIFRLDRLGIPLVEIITKPELYSAEQIKECALKIGEILRACKVKRGIGTIRQDLNISTRGHERVEIKGFQEPRIMIQTVDLEIARQQEELKEGKKEGAVRNVLENGESKFLRPISGGERMYPETDLPLLKISRECVNGLKKNLPKLRADIREELKKRGLNDELINIVLSQNKLDEFETLMNVYGKDANLVAKMITLWRTDEVKLTERVLEEILENVVDGKILEGDVREVMKRVFSGESLENALKIERVSADEIEQEISKIVKEKPGLRANAYMGMVMAKFKGKLDAKRAMEIINKVLEGK